MQNVPNMPNTFNYGMNGYRNFNMPTFYRVIPVMSEGEINNITVDFNGTPTYFHNQTTNEIYVKQFDIRTGLTTTQKFIKSDNVGQDSSSMKQSENINLSREDIHALNNRLDGLEKAIANLDTKGSKNVK